MKRNILPSLSEITHTLTLPNGLRAYIIPKHDAPVVSIQAYMRTGSIHEEEFLGCGLSHFLEHMLFMGSSRYPGNSASDKVTALGGYFNACTSRDYTSYITFLPSKYAADGVDILDDMLRNPLFPAEKFASEKNVILRESAMYDDSPDSRMDDELASAMFRFHPARIPIIGYQDKIRSVTREMMCAYYQRRYSPNRCFYVIVGDVDPIAVSGILQEKCSSWSMGDLREPVLPQEPRNAAFCRTSFTFNDPQTRIGIGWKTPSCSAPDYASIRGFLNLLVQSDDSRLDRGLVMEKELAYDVLSGADRNEGFASATVYATCRFENLDRLSDELFRITEDFVKKGPSAKELEGAVTRMRAAHCNMYLTTENLAMLAGNALQCTGSVESVDAYVRSFESMSVESVMEAGRNYFTGELAVEVDMIPEEKAAAAKKKLSRKKKNQTPVMFKDKQGRRVIVMEDPSDPFIHVRLVLPCGIFCGKGYGGAGSLLADVLSAGTEKYTEEEICELLSDNAVSLDIRPTNTMLTFTMTMLRDKAEQGFEILRSILQEPAFEEKKIRRERESLTEELKTSMNNPEVISFEKFFTEMTGGYPYLHTSAEILKSLKTITREDLIRIWHNVCLIPGKTVIGFSGNLTEKEAGKYASLLLSSLPVPKTKLPDIPPAKYVPGVRKVKMMLEKNQSMLLTGFPGVSVGSPEISALSILKEAAGSMSSRLFNAVRNENGLAYYTGVRDMDFYHAGSIIYYAGTEKKSLKKLEKIFEDEIAFVREHGLTSQEIADAKKWILFRDAVHKQSPSRLIGVMAEAEFFDEGFMAPLKKAERIGKLSDKEINEVICRLLSSPTRLTVTVAPSDKKTEK